VVQDGGWVGWLESGSEISPLRDLFWKMPGCIGTVQAIFEMNLKIFLKIFQNFFYPKNRPVFLCKNFLIILPLGKDHVPAIGSLEHLFDRTGQSHSRVPVAERKDRETV
jgi:hypothetical protein